MNRRNFLSTLIGGIAATAATRQFPFRVFSFPTEIKSPLAELNALIASWNNEKKFLDWYAKDAMKQLAIEIDSALEMHKFGIGYAAPGTKLTIRKPHRFLTPKELNQKFPNAQVLTRMKVTEYN